MVKVISTTCSYADSEANNTNSNSSRDSYKTENTARQNESINQCLRKGKQKLEQERECHSYSFEYLVHPSMLPPQQVGSESKLESMATASGTCTKLFLCLACMSQQQHRTILELQGSVQALASESEMLKLRAVVVAIQNASNHGNTETTITAAGGNEQPWNNVVE